MQNENNTRQNRIRDALARIYDDQPAYFQEYLRRYRENPQSRVFAPLAETYRRMGKLDEALRICEQGMEQHPKFHAGRVTYAKCLFDKKEFEHAVKELEIVIDEVPENILAQQLLGDSYLAVSNFKEATHHFKMALMLSPGDASIARKIHLAEKGEKNLETQAEHSQRQDKPNPASSSASPSSAAPELTPAEPNPAKANEAAPKDPRVEMLASEPSDDSEVDDDDVSAPGIDSLLGASAEPAEESFKIKHVSRAFRGNDLGTEITTETLGDLYFSQGLYDRSLRIFEKIAQKKSHPDLLKKIDDCRKRLGVDPTRVARDRKIEVLQGILTHLEEDKTPPNIA